MVAKDINGKEIAQTIRNELKERVSQLCKETNGKVPGLAVILVGSRRDSQTYVNMKKRACQECGIQSFGYDFDESVSQDEILNCIAKLNANTDCHGILVQLPLPSHMNENQVLHSIAPEKDVDGLHPSNVAALMSTSTHNSANNEQRRLDWTKLDEIPFSVACTPLGCIELLDRSGITIQGKNAVVVGRSNLVGIPVAMLLLHRNATVTVVHSKTTNAPSIVSQADIVICAVGKAGLVTQKWLKPGAVVIDVGINAITDQTKKRGYRLVGDCQYDDCREVASYITPVPGGVGPMTIACLMRNTVRAFRQFHNLTTTKGSEDKENQALSNGPCNNNGNLD